MRTTLRVTEVVKKARRRRRSRRVNLSEAVYQQLRAAILRQDYPPGARVSEEEVAQRLRVSRTPLRDALKQLESEGLVVRKRYQGVYVKRPSPDEVLELLDLREVLEGLAARLAAANLSEADLERLGEIFHEAEKLNLAGRYDEYLERATRFHELLEHVSGSELLSRFMQNMYDRVRLVRSRTIHLPGRARCSLEEHRELLDAIRERNSERAEAVNRARIRAIKRDVVMAFERSLFW